jgi:adenine-specific DNA-methyltransferase
VASESARKRHGQHYTPANLAAFLARRAVRASTWPGAVRVLDPACGDGELLLAAYRALGAGSTVSGGSAPPRLVGFDLDGAAIDQARRRFAKLGIEAELDCVDFLAVVDQLPPRSTDLLITNPPYVRTQVLGAQLSADLATRFGLSGRVDLTHPFVAAIPRILTGAGVLGLLCSNRFLTTRAGQNVRSTMNACFDLVELYDLGDTRLFDAAVLPAIVVARPRAEPQSQPQSQPAPAADRIGDRPSPAGPPVAGPVGTRFVSVYETPGATPTTQQSIIQALAGSAGAVVGHGRRVFTVTVGRLDRGEREAGPWRLAHAGNARWHGVAARSRGLTIGDLAKIHVGIKTTADPIFIRADWHRLDDPVRPEPELLLPLLTHRELDRWRQPAPPALRVLYPYDLTTARRRLVDMSRFPRSMNYLAQYADRLAGRRYLTAAGREWYEIWVPQQPAVWAHPKIVFPDISDRARFAVDRSGAVVNGDCYWMSVTERLTEELAYLVVAVANSSFGLRFYDAVCGNRLYAGRRRWITQYVGLFPVPPPAAPAAARIVAAARQLENAPVGQRAELEARLDSLVDAAFADA